MFETLFSQIGAVVVVLVIGFAVLKGDEPERIGAGAYALGFLASLLVVDRRGSDGPELIFMAIDAGMLAVFGYLTWKSRRAWPIWATALQALTVASHLLLLWNNQTKYNAFLTVINLAQYGVLIALAVGTFWAWQERRAAGLE